MSVDITQTAEQEGVGFLAEPATSELSIVIVSHNVREMLAQCLRSVFQALQGIGGEVIVVDNASDDGTVAALMPEFPQVCWIPLTTNVGFGRANNIGIARARGHYVLLLNPDTLIGPDTLRAMLAYMEQHPEVGIAGCRVLNRDGSFQETCRRGFPTPWVAFTRLFGLERLFPRSRLFARYSQGFRDEQEVGYVEVISGAFMFCRREVLRELRGFDPEYFLYGEDIDLCYRAHLAGWRIGYVGTVSILHFKGESTRRSTTDALFHFYEAMRIFVRRYYRGSPLVPILRVGITVREVLARALRYPNLWLLGLADLVGVTVALLVATRLRFGDFFGLPAYAYPTVFLAVGGVVVGMMLFFGDYLERRVQLARAAMAYALSMLAVATLASFFKDYAFSRWVMLGTSVGGTLWGIGVRAGVQRWLRRGMRLRRVAVLGRGPVAHALAAALQRQQDTGLFFLGLIHYGDEPLAREDGVSLLGSSEALPELVERWRIHELVVATPELPPGELVAVAERLARWRVRLSLAQSSDELWVQRFVRELLGYEPAWVEYPILHPRLRLLKRSMDVLCAILALSLGLPFVFLSAHRWSLLRRWWLVLRGHWSVVGIEPQDGEHHAVAKLGLLTLARLGSAGELSPTVLRQLNHYYVRHYSLALDVEIVLTYCLRRLRREIRPRL